MIGVGGDCTVSPPHDGAVLACNILTGPCVSWGSGTSVASAARQSSCQIEASWPPCQYGRDGTNVLAGAGSSADHTWPERA